MPIQAVVGNVDLSADEPFCKRLVPFQNGMPFLKPIESFGLLCPKRRHVLRCLVIKFFVFLKTLDVSLFGKFRRRRKDPLLMFTHFYHFSDGQFEKMEIGRIDELYTIYETPREFSQIIFVKRPKDN